jgi:hypothetical protein
MNSQATNPATSTKEKADGYLVVARFLNAKKDQKYDFPLFTVICDDPDEAIAEVLSRGFAFTKGAWALRAIHIGLVGQKRKEPESL